MKKSEWIEQMLDLYVPNPEIPLQYTNAYTLLIAVVLSARCTDARVNQVTPFLFALAATPAQMVQLSIEEIQQIIRPCGLSPAKAQHIWHLSQILLEQYNEEVPASMTALESLPGVGHKTASVIMVQAFGRPAFPVDTHVFRSARRWGLSKGTTTTRVEKDLKRQFSEEKWGKIHLQIILFARSYCRAQVHCCCCPICSSMSNSSPLRVFAEHSTLKKT